MPPPDPPQIFLQWARQRAFARADVHLALADPDDLSLDIVPQDGRPFRLSLANLWLETRDLPPAQRLAALDRRLDAALAPTTVPSDRVAALGALRSVLRPASTVVLPGLGADDPLVWRPALPCLVEALVCDLGPSFTFLRGTDLESWGLSPEQAFERAGKNVDAGVLSPWDEEARPPLLQLETDDEWTSSRLLQSGWLTSRGPDVHGVPVAAIPHAQLLLITAAESAALTRLARTALAEYLASPSPISPALYSARDGVVLPLRLPDSHPAAQAVALAHLRLATDEYEAAGEPLARIDPTPQARFTVLREGGALRSRVAWRQPTQLLPEADEVLLADGRVLPWSQVQGGLERVPGIWPRWWRSARVN